MQLSYTELILAAFAYSATFAAPFFFLALFPRLLIQGAGNPAGGEWLPFGLLLGAVALIVVGVVAAIAWLHGRATTAARSDQSPAVQPQRTQRAQRT